MTRLMTAMPSEDSSVPALRCCKGRRANAETCLHCDENLFSHPVLCVTWSNTLAAASSRTRSSMAATDSAVQP
jgi:hypothetical protein